MKLQNLTIVLLACLAGCGGSSSSSTVTPPVIEPPPPEGDSVARQWNDVLLEAIRDDFARPTVHARNLFHVSAAMYDAWAAFGAQEKPYLLGEQVHGFDCPLDSIPQASDIETARNEAIATAAYRLIIQRFALSPGVDDTTAAAETLLQELGLDATDTSLDYAAGSPVALGNYIADCYIRYGLQDGSNEQGDYSNRFYSPVNPGILPRNPGNPDIVNLDRWQPISLSRFVDQSGNQIANQPEFLGPEWGQVSAFALADTDRTIYQRDGFDYPVYFDPGAPPSYAGDTAEQYKWGFSMVSIWGAQLDPADGVMIDISPASIGNIVSLPATTSEFDAFYDYLNGGDSSQGRPQNPATGQPYEQQIVPRGDYARVLAEFWADGPDSETPPGHWFVILNEVSDHPDLVKRFTGTGPVLRNLEWDIKSYFTLGGAMHDSAVAAWGIKGWYDYIRPLSAIRAMAARGQSSDPSAMSYHEDGLPLEPGYIELVVAGDPLEGPTGENIGKIKLKSWRGPDYIAIPAADVAGVGWILAERWWPYQRPSFVTPPFAGYVSGHSTYSRAAAEVMTGITGDEFFPGGMSGFEIEASEFLVFEDGPSVNMTLQWATYRDASDQCSLSRIWGGIHPPADDIPGRIIGEQIGINAFNLAIDHFAGSP